MKFFKKQQGQFISQVVVLAMIFGFAAGVVGQIVADVYIDPWRQDYISSSLNPNTNIATIIPELRRVKKFLGIEQDFEVNKSIDKVSPTLAGIYVKRPPSRNPLSQIYLPADLQTNGFILTSDGWLVSYGEVFDNFRADQLVVIYEGKIFGLEDIVTDSTTGVVFIKIAANNLPVIVLGDSDELVLGQLIIVLNDLGEAVVANVKNTAYQPATVGVDFVVSSEEYNKSILLTDSLNETYLGSPVLNLGGEVVGVIKAVNQTSEIVTAVPINQFRSIVLDVLRSSLVKRSFLGVSYLDLAWVVGLDSSLTQGLKRGALVYQNPKRNSPAADASIQANDIIVSIDGQLIDKNNSLTDLIQQYQPGDKVILEFLRAGQTINRNVTLVILSE